MSKTLSLKKVSVHSDTPQVKSSHILPENIRNDIYNVMLNAAIIHEPNGNWRLYISKEKNKKVGLTKKIFERIQHATPDAMNILINALASGIRDIGTIR